MLQHVLGRTLQHTPAVWGVDEDHLKLRSTQLSASGQSLVDVLGQHGSPVSFQAQGGGVQLDARHGLGVVFHEPDCPGPS